MLLSIDFGYYRVQGEGMTSSLVVVTIGLRRCVSACVGGCVQQLCISGSLGFWLRIIDARSTRVRAAGILNIVPVRRSTGVA